jgi:hypothetical protein
MRLKLKEGDRVRVRIRDFKRLKSQPACEADYDTHIVRMTGSDATIGVYWNMLEPEASSPNNIFWLWADTNKRLIRNETGKILRRLKD